MQISTQNPLNSLLKTPWNLTLKAGKRMALTTAQALCVSQMNKIKVGSLAIVAQGEKLLFGKADSDLKATLHVENQNFWYRVMVFNALVLIALFKGLGEAFMYGDFSCDDIPAFLTVFVVFTVDLGRKPRSLDGWQKFFTRWLELHCQFSLH